MRWSMRWMIVTGAALLAAGPLRAASAALPVTQSQDFVRAASQVAVGSSLRLENVQVADTGEPQTLVLERFEVFARDAKITVHGEAGQTTVLPAPANAYFRGTIDGRPGSRAFVAVLANGATQGLIADDDAIYLIGGDDAATAKALALGGPLEMQRVDPVLLKASRNSGFRCDNDKLPSTPGSSLPVSLGATAFDPAAVSATSSVPAHTAMVAIESDYEFYQLFNNTTAATTYIGNLIGYASTIYVSEINTSLAVQSVDLWSTPSDPWTQTDSFCGLLEFGKYWNQNKTGVTRTTAHFLSGKATGGGVSWVGVLCRGAFQATTGSSPCSGLGATETSPYWGGAYGFTGNLFGTFNINSPSVVWDIDAVAHEIGHNFDSPHSHCYGGIGGNASPIDQCYNQETGSGCYTGATESLPGPAGQGSGTIMSYCHLLNPGMSNIKLTFGNNETYGVHPEREAALMSSYVTSVANASCLAPVVTAGLFSDGFEGGTLPGPWSGKTP
jgi:hypothetical protein